ncbi:hypothetical protein K474DRAFT_1693455 [Panus rudis PR-1116 ss-1]|nr:hypothetical protein K474DRAFT_1693455 [Panus rudis PR-1116 ss-1]
MFARGSRFPKSKTPEVSGPNAYDVHDPEWDAYKKGAFLEKTDRFKEKGSEVPGPGTYDTDMKPSQHKPVPVKSGGADRYAILQRKVEELERLYNEGKKTHQAEVERFKQELSRAQRTNTEQSERLQKLQKQNDTLDSRVQELKKTNDTSQAEIKDLRAKLRVSEHERTQLASKQGEASETKKALQALDLRRREEVRERDKKVADLEKALSSEKKKREALESRLAETKGKVDGEVQTAKATMKTLETELKRAKAEAQESKSALAALRAEAADTEEELLEQLEQHRVLLSRVAGEYGKLASSTISKTEYQRLKYDSATKDLRIVRLERKLANSEGQVVELAHLIRSTKNDNQLLSQQLKEAQADTFTYASLLRDVLDERPLDHSADRQLESQLGKFADDLRDFRSSVQQALSSDTESWAELDRLRAGQLLLHSTSLLKHIDNLDAQLIAKADELSKAQTELKASTQALEVLQTEQATLRTQLAEVTANLAISQTAAERAKEQLEEVQATAKADAEKMQKTVAHEKQAAQKLAAAVSQAKVAEEGLRADIEQLTSDLAEAERYQEAYADLVEEVGALIQRNALAEEEATRLSRFNAEILGHNNPAQRIQYVDRIRRELFETKQQLLLCTRDRDAVLDENSQLRYELDMYKAVTVPLDAKPKTSITRVPRVPLGTQNTNVNGKSTNVAASVSAKRLESTPEVDCKEGDMTVDEIM